MTEEISGVEKITYSGALKFVLFTRYLGNKPRVMGHVMQHIWDDEKYIKT
jgi:hypothetical protein